MSRVSSEAAEPTPLLVLIERAHRAMQQDMVRFAHESGYPDARPAHNAVFGRLPLEGARTSELAARAGVTRQSMGELVREMVDLGILQMTPDPEDRRAKLVTYTPDGLSQARSGREHILDLEQRFIEEFGAADYQTARDVLERLVKVLGD